MIKNSPCNVGLKAVWIQKDSTSNLEFSSNHNFLKTAWRLFENCLKTVWRLFEDCLKTAWRLFEDCSKSVWRLFEDCLKTVQRVFEDCLKIVWSLFKECLRTVWTMLHLLLSDKFAYCCVDYIFPMIILTGKSDRIWSSNQL